MADAKASGAKAGYTTVDGYIAQCPPETRAVLEQVRATIKAAAPKATEKLSWQMPTYHQKENLIHFAAHKNHLGIYPGAEAMVHFAADLKDYHTSKGAVQFPYAKPIPYKLIDTITRWRVAQVEQG